MDLYLQIRREGGGEFIQTLSPEIRGGGLGGLKKIWSKKKRWGGGWRDPGPTSGSATAISLLWVRCQVRRSRLCGPRSVLATEFFFPLAFRRLQWNSQHAGKKSQMKKKLNRPFVFKCSIKVKLGRFALYSWNVGKEIFFTKKALCTYSVVVLLI